MARGLKIPGEVKIIKVSLEVREELRKLKRKPYEPYDMVIRRLLKHYKESVEKRLLGY